MGVNITHEAFNIRLTELLQTPSLHGGDGDQRDE